MSDKAPPCPLNQVNRQYHAPAPNVLWISNFTYVATRSRFVHVAFVIDVYARYIVDEAGQGSGEAKHRWMAAEDGG